MAVVGGSLMKTTANINVMVDTAKSTLRTSLMNLYRPEVMLNAKVNYVRFYFTWVQAVAYHITSYVSEPHEVHMLFMH